MVLACLALPASAGAAGSVYVVNSEESTVSQYMIGLGGPLSPLTPATVATGSLPFGIAVSSDGKSAYATDYSANTVSQYTIEPLSGALSPITPATVATGNGPFGVEVTPDGKSAYVTNFTDSTVSQYTIEPSGALSPKTPATVASGTNPEFVAVTPDGKNAYVTNYSANTVSQYTIEPSGALLPMTPSTVAAGAYARSIAVGPLPCGAMQVKTRTLPAAIRGMMYKAELAACGGVPPYKWKKVGALPKGLKLSKTGVISGTPSAKKVAPGSHSVGVKVTDSKKHSATATLTLNVS